jgi:hypothetical protein
MSKLAWIAALAMLTVVPAAGQSALVQGSVTQSSFPDLRGTWKGESETIVMGAGNSHHPEATPPEPRLTSVPFTLTIDRQEGRRFSGTFSSARATEVVIGVMSRTGTLFVVDDDGYDFATLLGPNRMEMCYLHVAPDSRIASCTELTRQEP